MPKGPSDPVIVFIRGIIWALATILIQHNWFVTHHVATNILLSDFFCSFDQFYSMWVPLSSFLWSHLRGSKFPEGPNMRWGRNLWCTSHNPTGTFLGDICGVSDKFISTSMKLLFFPFSRPSRIPALSIFFVCNFDSQGSFFLFSKFSWLWFLCVHVFNWRWLSYETIFDIADVNIV